MSAEAVKALRVVSEVRRVQSMAKELAVTRAAAAVRDCDEELRNIQERGDQLEIAWSNALGQLSLDVAMARAWSDAILKSDRSTRNAEKVLQSARADQRRAVNDWSQAKAKVEMVEGLEGCARQRHRRKIEDRNLSEVADRFARRGDEHED